MLRNTNDWIIQYRKKAALWIHDGNPKRPHALLTSGKHSNGFFNSRLVIPDELLLREAVSDLVELFGKRGGEISKVECVVGPQTGATRLAEFISDHVFAYERRTCHWVSPAKTGEEKDRRFTLTENEFSIISGHSVLLCEDVITTGGSIDLVARKIKDTQDMVGCGAKTLPFVLALVNRSGFTELNGKKIIALIDRSMPIWMPDQCPLCKLGSEAIRPKDNWAKLND